jgi:acyl-CoA reductase-like NAD-dependent aldehyde dehydrogenase
VADLPDAARLVQEEQFGPVLPVLAYDDLDEALGANATPTGLAARCGAPAERGAQWPRGSTAARCGSTAISICRSTCRWAEPSNPGSGASKDRGAGGFHPAAIVNVAL